LETVVFSDTFQSIEREIVNWRNIAISNNVGGVKHFLSTPLHALEEERHFALVGGLRFPTWARTPAQKASGPFSSVISADDNTSPIFSSPIYAVTIHAGYRLWELIAPSHEAILDELRAFWETL
jgi:hypothetical protein